MSQAVTTKKKDTDSSKLDLMKSSKLYVTLFIICIAVVVAITGYSGYVYAYNITTLSLQPSSWLAIFIALLFSSCSLVTIFIMSLFIAPKSLAETPDLDELTKNSVADFMKRDSENIRYLDPNDILEKSFEYARGTADQAMEHRLTTVNFFLLIVGGAGSGVVALLAAPVSDRSLLEVGAIGILWVISLIGWLMLMQLIRLRMAWFESVTEMNSIKRFYFKFSETFSEKYLTQAFFFKPTTVPMPFKHWNVFHFSVILIGILDASLFLGGAMLLSLHTQGSGFVVIPFLAMFVIILLAHSWVYDIQLRRAFWRKSKINETNLEEK